MVRVTSGYKRHKKHKRILKMVAGMQGTRNRLYRTAVESLERGLVYNYRDRKEKKRYFRKLWITRINAAVRMYGMNYSGFMHRLKERGILLNRKILSQLSLQDSSFIEGVLRL